MMMMPFRSPQKLCLFVSMCVCAGGSHKLCVACFAPQPAWLGVKVQPNGVEKAFRASFRVATMSK